MCVCVCVCVCVCACLRMCVCVYQGARQKTGRIAMGLWTPFGSFPRIAAHIVCCARTTMFVAPTQLPKARGKLREASHCAREAMGTFTQ